MCTDEDGNLRVWDLTANACSAEVAPDGKTPLQSVSVASDASTVAAVSNLGTCFLWRLDQSATRSSALEPIHKMECHSSYVLKCLFSPDARYLATTSADHTVKLWDLDNGFALDKTLVGHTAWVWSCGFSADSAYLVTASSDKTGKLWDLKNGEIILDYRGHTKALTSVALNDC
jgi:G protein beta subunit-like protein